MASTPAPAAPRSSRNRPKHPAKAAGSRSRKIRENVSWLGIPFSSRRKSRNKTSRSTAKSAKSEQLSAPQIDAVSAIVRTSKRSCRLAFPVRGSGKAANTLAYHDIGGLLL